MARQDLQRKMTTEEKKAWLKRYCELGKELEPLFYERESWQALMTRTTRTYSVKTNGPADPHSWENIMARVIELDEQINATIGYMLDTRAEINAAIERVQDDAQRTLLRLRYIEGKKWEDIATLMNYDIAGHKVFLLHRKALLSIEIDSAHTN